MLKNFLKNRRGQGSAVEYAVLFFLIVAAITAMTVYVKRALQARVRGARNYAWIQVNQAYRTLHPAGNDLPPVIYDPYYVSTRTDKAESSVMTETHAPWTNHEGKFQTDVFSEITAQTVSNVAPAARAE